MMPKNLFIKNIFIPIYLSIYALRIVLQVIYIPHRVLTTSTAFIAVSILGFLSIKNFRLATILLSILITLSSVYNVIGIIILAQHGITTRMFGYTFGTTFMLISTIFMNMFFLIGAIRLWKQ